MKKKKQIKIVKRVLGKTKVKKPSRLKVKNKGGRKPSNKSKISKIKKILKYLKSKTTKKKKR